MISHSFRRVLLAKKQLVHIQNVRTCYPVNCQYYVSMPRVHIKPAEKIFWLLALSFSLVSLPTWILYNLPYYRGEERKAGIYMDDDDDYN